MTPLEEEILKAIELVKFEAVYYGYTETKEKTYSKAAAKIARERIEKAWDAGYESGVYSEQHGITGYFQDRPMQPSKEEWLKDNLD